MVFTVNRDSCSAAGMLAIRRYTHDRTLLKTQPGTFPDFDFSKSVLRHVSSNRFTNDALGEIEVHPIGFEPITLGSEDRFSADTVNSPATSQTL